MTYKQLEKEYITLSQQSEDFVISKEFKLEEYLKAFYSHPVESIGLDIARDYLYFNDIYKIEVKKDILYTKQRLLK